jgi:hypothetical protein
MVRFSGQTAVFLLVNKDRLGDHTLDGFVLLLAGLAQK